MKRIFKLQCFSLKYAYDLLLLLFIVMLLFAYELFLVYDDEITASSTMETIYGVGVEYVIIFFVGLMAVSVGMDFPDKTINYNIMYGCRRRDVFLGRFFAGLVVGLVIVTIFDAVPVIAMCITNGFSMDTPAYTLVVRYIGSILAVIRMAAEIALLTVLVKRPYLSAVISYGVGLIETSSLESLKNISCFFTGITSTDWFYYDSYSTFGENGGTKMVVEGLPSVSYMAGSMVSSVVIGVLCLVVACKVFDRQDID